MTHSQNVVELMGTYGSDETHALSAWTSTSRDLDDDKRSRMDGLLQFLADNEHHTPFEKSSIHFLVTTDIASHVHLLKHRIGVSVNAESARYKELKDDKYYVPVDWDDDEVAEYVAHVKSAFKLYHKAIKRLEKKGLSRKRAKESARFYIPYGSQITSDVMFNFRSFYHFLKLRYSEHAQLEIREIAKKMLQLVIDSGVFSKTLVAFGLIDANGVMRQPFE